MTFTLKKHFFSFSNFFWKNVNFFAVWTYWWQRTLLYKGRAIHQIRVSIEFSMKGFFFTVLGSISPTFDVQLLCAMILKAQKDTDNLTVYFALLCSVHVKVSRKMLVKSPSSSPASSSFENWKNEEKKWNLSETRARSLKPISLVKFLRVQ